MNFTPKVSAALKLNASNYYVNDYMNFLSFSLKEWDHSITYRFQEGECDYGAAAVGQRSSDRCQDKGTVCITDVQKYFHNQIASVCSVAVVS